MRGVLTRALQPPGNEVAIPSGLAALISFRRCSLLAGKTRAFSGPLTDPAGSRTMLAVV